MWLRYAAATALFLAAFVAAFHSIVLHPGSRILNGSGFSDAAPGLRQYWAMSVQHKNPLDFKRDALSAAPQGTEASTAVGLASGALQTAFVWVSRHAFGFVGAWNLFFVLSMLATSVAMFALLDWLGCTFVAALFGGYVFGFNTYALERAYAGHLGLLSNWVFVLLLAALLWSRRRSLLTSSAAVGGTIALAFYNSAYLALFAAFMAFVYFAIDLVGTSSSPSRRRTVALAVSSYAVFVLAILPVLVLYERDRAAVQTRAGHSLADVYAYAVSAGRYLVPSARNPLVHWLTGERPSRYLVEHSVFFGFSSLVFAVVGVVLFLRGDRWLRAWEPRRRTLVFVAVLAPAAFLMSLAPTVSVGPVRVPMPSWLLAHATTFWRVYARFGLLVGFSFAVVAALALTALSRRPGRGWSVLPSLALVVVVLELLPGNVGALDTRYRPGWVGWLASHPNGIVASYPFFLGQVPAADLIEADYWYQTLDGHPRFQSVAPDLTSRSEAIRFLARDVEEPLAGKVLATEGVRYVVLHDDVYRADGQAVPTPDPGSFTLLRRFGPVRIYSVHAPHVNIERALAQNQGIIGVLQGQELPSLSIGSGFHRTEVYNGAPSHWMIQNGQLEIENKGGPMRIRITGVSFSNRVSRTLQVVDDDNRVIGRQSIPTYAVPLRLPSFIVPHGETTLTLTTFPGPQPLGPGDRRNASVYVSGIESLVLPVWTMASQ
jgi:hypothetical protein